MQSPPLSRPRRIIVWLFFAAAGTFFSQSDLAHTVFSSYAILQGHILDFYDFNAKILVGDDYQILVYSVVALWMSPMHILGLATSHADYSGLSLNLAELVWAKAGLSALLIVCANFLEKIVKKLSEGSFEVNADALLVFSPFALFPVVVMGQYDVVGLTLTLMALHAWLNKQQTKFLVLLSIAACFKYFPLLLLVPLLLFGFQSKWRLIRDLLFMISPLALQFVVFSSNAAFRRNLGRQPAQILGLDGSSLLVPAGRLALFVLVTFGVLWIRRRFSTFIRSPENSLILAYTMFSAVFVVVRWNPQWLIYLVPFWVILLYKVRRPYLLLAIETLGFAGLVIMTANLWSNNLDDSMAQYSPLGHLLPERVLRLNQVLPPVLLPYGVALAYIAIVAPPAIYWIQRIRGLDVSDGGFGLRNVGWLKLTSFIAFFLVPTLACYFVPASSAKDLGANVALNSLQRTRSTHFHSQLLELEPGTRIIVRNFTMEQKTKAFSLDVNTSGLPYSGTLVAELNAINAPASRNAYKLSSAVKASKDNSFPGFKGWLEVAFLDRVGYLPAGKSVLTLTNHSSQSIKLWLDTVRPTQSTVVDGSTVLPGAALVTGFYTSKR